MKYEEKSELLHRLRAENKSLKKENEYLRHRLEQLGERSREKTREQAVLYGVLVTTHATRIGTYFGYLLFRLRVSRWFRVFDKTSFAVRGFLLASKLWRIAMTLFAVIGIGAQVLLVVGVFAVLLPALVVFSVLAGVIGFYSYRKWNRHFQSLVIGKKVYILFLPKRCEKSSLLFRTAHALEKDGIVFGVSRSIGFGGGWRFKKEGEQFYKIPLGYYFSFKKHMDTLDVERLIVIH